MDLLRLKCKETEISLLQILKIVQIMERKFCPHEFSFDLFLDLSIIAYQNSTCMFEISFFFVFCFFPL